MQISTIDIIVVILFFGVTILIGLWAGKSSGKTSTSYFLSNRDMPWWLLGVSMVATTFSADTPNLVTDIVRKNGVSGNWTWWAFLLTGMLTVFVYAKLWRRSGILTDLEFYELRYSGRAASFLRAFRSIYLGVFFNVMIMGTVMLAGIKISSILMGWSAIQTITIVSIVVVFFSTIGGFKGVVMADFFQFILSMVGMIAAAIFLLNMPEIGGLSNLISHEAVQGKMNFFPDFGNTDSLVLLFIMPIAVQWWSVWYPGAEPGGGGYIAQRMLSAKDEKNAIMATLLFNLAHYAFRPWPWLLIALSSIILFPELSDIRAAFPDIDPSLINDDLAFPAMLSYLPTGLLGLVIASLLAALMSTISTHLNWGASYVVNDFYKRFIEPDASEIKLVQIGKLTTILLMLAASLVALILGNALTAFNILLQIGAGTGLIFILRWFWWRINAVSEIVAMIVSFLVAIYFEILHVGEIAVYQKLLVGIAITSVAWITATFVTRPTEMKTLTNFYNLIKPHDIGWKPVIQQGRNDGTIKLENASTGGLAQEILLMVLGSFAIYSLLFFTGNLLYHRWGLALICFVIFLICGILMRQIWNKK